MNGDQPVTAEKAGKAYRFVFSGKVDDVACRAEKPLASNDPESVEMAYYKATLVVPKVELVKTHTEHGNSPRLEDGRICINAQDKYKKALWKVSIQPPKDDAGSDYTAKVASTASGAGACQVTVEGAGPGRNQTDSQALKDGQEFLAVGGDGVGAYELTLTHNAFASCKDKDGEKVFKFVLRQTEALPLGVISKATEGTYDNWAYLSSSDGEITDSAESGRYRDVWVESEGCLHVGRVKATINCEVTADPDGLVLGTAVRSDIERPSSTAAWDHISGLRVVIPGTPLSYTIPKSEDGAMASGAMGLYVSELNGSMADKWGPRDVRVSRFRLWRPTATAIDTLMPSVTVGRVFDLAVDAHQSVRISCGTKVVVAANPGASRKARSRVGEWNDNDGEHGYIQIEEGGFELLNIPR